MVCSRRCWAGRYSYSQDTIGGRVLSAGERLAMFVPHFPREGDQWKRFDQERFRIRVQVLGDLAAAQVFERGRAASTASGSSRRRISRTSRAALSSENLPVVLEVN